MRLRGGGQQHDVRLRGGGGGGRSNVREREGGGSVRLGSNVSVRLRGGSSMSEPSLASFSIFERMHHFLVAFFIRPFYKMMLGKPVTLEDMQSVVSLGGGWS